MSDTNAAELPASMGPDVGSQKVMIFDLRPDRFVRGEGAVVHNGAGLEGEVTYADSMRENAHGHREFDDHRQTIPRDAIHRAMTFRWPLMIVASRLGDISPLGDNLGVRILHQARSASRFQRLFSLDALRLNSDAHEHTRRYWPEAIEDVRVLVLGVCREVCPIAAFGKYDVPPPEFERHYIQRHATAGEKVVTMMFYRTIAHSPCQLARVLELRIESEIPPTIF